MSNKEIPYKIYLEENEMPDSWYNVRADMKKKPAPLLNPATLEPLKPEELEPVFCKELVKQELNDTDAYIPILVCIPSSRQLKKYKIFVLPGWISGNIFMPPIVAFHEIPLVLRLQVLSVAGRLYSNLYIL
nr:hypothetical protein [Anaerobutyricum hallii]